MDWMGYGALFIALGCGAGYLAGLFGVGGGIILTPMLLIAFEHMGMDTTIAVAMAVGTSLAIVAVTAVFSAQAHHQNLNVDWQIAKRFFPWVVLGVGIGAMLHSLVPASGVLQALAVFDLLMGGAFIYQTLDAPGLPATRPAVATSTRQSWVDGSIGSGIGLISSFVGIGGGTLMVPYLHFSGHSINRAIGTAATLGVPIGLAGALTYSILGLQASAPLPAHTIGYVYLPALAGGVLGSVFTTRHGAALSKKLTGITLKRTFGGLLMGMGAHLAWRGLG